MSRVVTRVLTGFAAAAVAMYPGALTARLDRRDQSNATGAPLPDHVMVSVGREPETGRRR